MAQVRHYLLDTNACSSIIKKTAGSLDTQLRRIPIQRVGISTITQAELLYGLRKKPEAQRLAMKVHYFLRSANIFPWDSAAAIYYAAIRASTQRRGYSLSQMDMLIAAHALSTNRVLVTNDRAFCNVAGLRVEDWSAGTAFGPA